MNDTPSAPSVVAAILNWNNLADTMDCVASVLASDYPHLQVCVVDNGSRVDPSAKIRGRWPMVRVIRNSENLGYGGGNNVALKRAAAEGVRYVFLLNNDALVAPDTISRLTAVMEAHAKVGMATPRVFFHDRPADVYWDGGSIDWMTGEVPHESQGRASATGLIHNEWLDGCALFVRMGAVGEVGVLDERYFLYYEDVDWTVRAARAGWQNVVVPAASAWHKVSRSTGSYTGPLASFYYTRNRFLFLRTHGRLSRNAIPLLAYAPIAYRDYRRTLERRESRLAVLQACWSLLRGRFGPWDPSADKRLTTLIDLVLFPVTVFGRFLGRAARLIPKRVRRRRDAAARP